MQFHVIRQKMGKNKKCANYHKLYIFEKPLPRINQICKNICKMCIQGKLKICKFSLKASVKNYAKFLLKNCAISFLLFKAFQRAIKSQKLINRSRSQYRFSQVKTEDSDSRNKSTALTLNLLV